jgi:hypothetical protein
VKFTRECEQFCPKVNQSGAVQLNSVSYSLSTYPRLSAVPQGVPFTGIDVGELRKESRRVFFDYLSRVDPRRHELL